VSSSVITPVEPYTITLRAGNGELLELDWARSILEWTTPRLVDLPRGISRHAVCFVAFDHGTYAVKELPLKAAQRDYETLRTLQDLSGPAVRPVGLVIRTLKDPTSEAAACLITRYTDYSFSYRELLSGGTFGPRREQLLDAFALLLAELHLLGCFWGDCSLSNVLYRYDAGALETTLVDAETASVYPSLSEARRWHDLEIMIENVAGEMGDIAAQQGESIDAADIHMGEDIAARYHGIWRELRAEPRIRSDEQYRITESIDRLHELGFEVDEILLVPHPDREHIHLKAKVADRNYHTNRLRELTGIEAGENQARQLLSDLHYYEMTHGGNLPSSRALAAVRWRVEAFEPMLEKLGQDIPPSDDPVQAYCDLLHHRYVLSARRRQDVGTEVAYQDWLASGHPGYPLPAGA
jgi:uncharacterized protein DUF4032/lipopolysaccharide kinase (Kdo/WaaP) family protein